MAFLRRGHVTVPHKSTASIVLTRIDGSRIKIMLDELHFWEEFDISETFSKQTIVHHHESSTAVLETFDAIDAEVNRKAVQA